MQKEPNRLQRADDLVFDLFCGLGGASLGIEQALGRSPDLVVNHDPEAIRLHMVNHPDALHLQEDIFAVNMPSYTQGKHVLLMWASPDCRGFSRAKGAAPKSPSVRVLPWSVYKHAQAVNPDVIIMENVTEIQSWTKLGEDGRPVKGQEGSEYRRFINAMKGIGYTFDSRELVAADYGAPTSRKRWYAIFRRDGKPIKWPEPTHSRTGTDGKDKWLSCGDYIDFGNLGTSIYHRKKKLADTTLARIGEGFRKYIVNSPAPYFVADPKAYDYLRQYYSDADDGKMVSFITKFYKSDCGQTLFAPLSTITTSAAHFGLVTAFLVKYYGTGCGQTLSEPLSTITTRDRFGLVNIITEIDGEKWIIKDAFLRMLTIDEQRKCQGFPDSFILDHDSEGNPISLKSQMAKIGNSVVPCMAKAIVEANFEHLKVS